MIKPFFTIVIPSLNEEINLPVLLKSIHNQPYKEYEVIIVDCFSKDSTKERVEKLIKKAPQFKFIQKKTKNVSQARNLGASLAKGEFLIFFDADVKIGEPEFLVKIKKHIEEYNLDMLTVWNRPKTKNIVGRLTLMVMNLGMSLMQKLKPAANGPCIIIEKKLFNKLKGFDDTIVFGEDFEITQRAWKINAKFKVFPEPILYVSARRFEQEGIPTTVYKTIKSLLHQLFIGPIRKPIFEYKMGGQAFKETKK
jgi:glycosyltransferase involved in cell wall biosynthesis